MAKDFILMAADAIALREIGHWKSYYLIIRAKLVICVGVGLISKSDHIISRFTASQLESGLSSNQWNACRLAIKNFYEGKFKCPKPPKHSQPSKSVN